MRRRLILKENVSPVRIGIERMRQYSPLAATASTIVESCIVTDKRTTSVLSTIALENEKNDPAAELYEYAPMKTALSAPPYEFAP